MTLSSSLWSQTSQFQPPVVMCHCVTSIWYEQLNWKYCQLSNPCSHVVFERKKSSCSQNSLAIVWCLGANCNERRYSAVVGLAIQRWPNKRAQRGSQWLTVHQEWRPCRKSQQQNSWKSVVNNFRVIDMFSTNFTYFSLWNVVEKLQCLLSLCKMGAQNANRWTKKAAHQP
jgi:hypothetical protein